MGEIVIDGTALVPSRPSPHTPQHLLVVQVYMFGTTVTPCD